LGAKFDMTTMAAAVNFHCYSSDLKFGKTHNACRKRPSEARSSQLAGDA
jgi:hypothetical protein